MDVVLDEIIRNKISVLDNTLTGVLKGVRDVIHSKVTPTDCDGVRKFIRADLETFFIDYLSSDFKGSFLRLDDTLDIAIKDLDALITESLIPVIFEAIKKVETEPYDIVSTVDGELVTTTHHRIASVVEVPVEVDGYRTGLIYHCENAIDCYMDFIGTIYQRFVEEFKLVDETTHSELVIVF